MKNYLKITLGIILATAFMFGGFFVKAQTENTVKIPLYLFYGETCPHCKKAEIFLTQLEQKYPELLVKSYEVFGNKDNADLFLKFLESCGQGKSIRVPGMFIGEKSIIGYENDQTTGVEIENALKNCLEKSCPDPIQKVENECEKCDCKGEKEENCTCESCTCKKQEEKIAQTIKIPFFGNLDTSKVSLPLLTIIFGTVDGFNPCAMWVLLLLLSLLLTASSKKRMWLIVGIYLATEAVLYYLVMSAWLNAFLAISYLKIIRILIGIIAVVMGVWRVKDFINWKPGVCKATDLKQKLSIEEKIKKALKATALPATILGIIGLAFSVNIIEFFCSAGFPAIYTQILSMQSVSGLQKYLYLLLYNFFYMLDDLIVFSIAIVSLGKIGVTDKYNRWSTLIGGVLLLLLGVILVIRPELLMFN